MRLHRFYLQEKIADRYNITIESIDIVNQIGRVFRLKKTDKVIIFDGSGKDYECEIIDLNRNSVDLKVGEGNPSRFMPTRRVFLYQAIIKKDKFEWIVEKATELGVTDIIPVLAERSEKKSLNEDRLRKICIEASEQSGRGDVPSVGPIINLSTFNFSKDCSGQAIVFHTKGDMFSFESNSESESNKTLSIFIGPEGGWSPSEIEMFHTSKIPIYSLGKHVLRSETAAVVCLSKVLI